MMMNKFGRFLLKVLTLGYYGRVKSDQASPDQVQRRKQKGEIGNSTLHIPKGAKGYYFDRLGYHDALSNPWSEDDFSCTPYKEGDPGMVFRCVAINDYNAKRKFRKWAKDNLDNREWDEYVRFQGISGSQAKRR